MNAGGGLSHDTRSLSTEGVIVFDKFRKAFKLNPDLFDWDEITEDVMEGSLISSQRWKDNNALTQHNTNNNIAIEASIDKKALRNSITSPEESGTQQTTTGGLTALRTVTNIKTSGSVPIDPTERELLQKEQSQA